MSRLSAFSAILLASPAVADLSTVAVGRHFSIIQKTASTLTVLGDNTYGQLGKGDDDNATEISIQGEEIKDVAAGAFHSLFLTTGGKLYVSGSNNKGQLGKGDEPMHNMPQPVIDGGVMAIAAGYAHSIVLMEDGTVQVAGYNHHGQLGLGTDQMTQTTFSTLQDLPTITAIAAGYDFSYLLDVDKKVHAAGQNLAGQLGDGTFRSSSTFKPVMIPDEQEVLDIAAGESHGLFLTAVMVYATGAGFDGQLGEVVTSGSVNTPTGASTVPIAASQVYAGGDSSCVLLENLARGFGSNRDGQLGVGQGQETVQGPMEMMLDEAQTLAIGESHSLYVKLNTDVLGSGLNADNQLGDGAANIWEPTKISTAHSTTTALTEAPTMPPATTTPAGGTTAEPSMEPETTGAGEDTATTTTKKPLAGGVSIQGGDYSLTVWMVVVGFMGLILAVMMLRGGGNDDEGGSAEDSGRRGSARLNSPQERADDGSDANEEAGIELL